MCGIVGCVGHEPATAFLLQGLRWLQYRGYDSSGIAVAVGDGVLQTIKAEGKLSNLVEQIDPATPGTTGIAHTRWATHGAPTQRNAHPHCSPDDRIAVVHNGIFENFAELRTELMAAGFTFRSETDTECLPLLVTSYMRAGHSLEESFRRALQRIRGIYAVACLDARQPDVVLLARSGPPLAIGLGRGVTFFASDAAPFLEHTRRVIYLEDGDIAEVRADSVRVLDSTGTVRTREVRTLSYDAESVEKGRFDHFMQKEIFEQPEAVARTLAGRLSDGKLQLDLALSDHVLKRFRRAVVVACGTSWHAGLVAKFYLEHFARLPTEVDYASEYRYREPVVDSETLVIGITQSGETADTLAALKEAKRHGATTLVVCNNEGSTATRQCDVTLLTRAGTEIGVASTKAFTTQLVVLLMLALHAGKVRERLSSDELQSVLSELRKLPALIEVALAQEHRVVTWSRAWSNSSDVLYLARGPLYPIALEGALKLKEISYIHGEGYPAGEMKHGPIAMIDEKLPIIALIASDVHADKMVSNLQEAAARKGRALVISSEGVSGYEQVVQDALLLPATSTWLAPVVFSVPLQLLAYHIAVLRGTDVDQPRNLAKSVTVE
jgi:glutamine---fructose-6-phosphate transaminase (isomerizing)